MSQRVRRASADEGSGMPDQFRAGAVGSEQVPVIVTSPHPADFRGGLWETLREAWPRQSFAEIASDEQEEARATVLSAIGGMVMPPPAERDDLDAVVAYEISVLRERVLQGALYYTAVVLIAAEAAGYVPPHQSRRGQWVQFTLFALHAAVRTCADHLPGVGGARMEAELVEGTLRRLAHELPDAWAVPTDVPAVLAKLRADFLKASEAYTLLPVRWIDDTAPTCGWLLARASAQFLTGTEPDGMRILAPYVVELSEALIDGVDASSIWTGIGHLVPQRPC
jgi:hypothetical protein